MEEREKLLTLREEITNEDFLVSYDKLQEIIFDDPESDAGQLASEYLEIINDNETHSLATALFNLELITYKINRLLE